MSHVNLASVATGSGASGANVTLVRDPRADILKTLDQHKATLTAIGVDAADIDKIAQGLLDSERNTYNTALNAWDAEQDHLRDACEAARAQAEQDKLNQDDTLWEKLYCRKVPKAPAVLSTPLPSAELFHIPPALLEKLATHLFTALSLYLPETMEAYRDTVWSSTSTSTVFPIQDKDGSVQWVPHAEALNPKKVVPNRNLTLPQILKARNNLAKVMLQQAVSQVHINRWTNFFDWFDSHLLRNVRNSELVLVQAVANCRAMCHNHAARGTTTIRRTSRLWRSTSGTPKRRSGGSSLNCSPRRSVLLTLSSRIAR
jgi:hypothetical protein